MQRRTAICAGGISQSGSNPHRHRPYREQFSTPSSSEDKSAHIEIEAKEATLALVRVKAKPPVRVGQVILPNLLNSGVDVVATDDLLE